MAERVSTVIQIPLNVVAYGPFVKKAVQVMTSSLTVDKPWTNAHICVTELNFYEQHKL